MFFSRTNSTVYFCIIGERSKVEIICEEKLNILSVYKSRPAAHYPLNFAEDTLRVIAPERTVAKRCRE